MQYKKVIEAEFVDRPNRFIALVNIGGLLEKAHVKNTGRCRELLIPGAVVFLEVSDNPDRKTKYSLIGVKKGERLINMDSQVPNTAAWEFIQEGRLFGGPLAVFRERTYGDSRFDLYIESGSRKIFAEVKGVTLEEDGIARFPDAPTLRGIKHIRGLIQAVKNGYEAYLIFIIQMKPVTCFEPNDKAQPEFRQALLEALSSGVHILAYDCIVGRDSLRVDAPVTVKLHRKT